MALLYSIGQLILGVYPKFHMNQSLGLTDLMYCQCSSADWNAKDTNIWGESAHYTKGM